MTGSDILAEGVHCAFQMRRETDNADSHAILDGMVQKIKSD